MKGLSYETNLSALPHKKGKNARLLDAILDAGRAVCLEETPAYRAQTAYGVGWNAALKSLYSFPKGERLKRSRDIRWVMETGRKFVGSFVILFARKSPEGSSKAAFVVGRRVGNAVARNRVKRLMREAYRLRKPLWGKGGWLVFLARAGRGAWVQSQIHEEFEKFVGRIQKGL